MKHPLSISTIIVSGMAALYATVSYADPIEDTFVATLNVTVEPKFDVYQIDSDLSFNFDALGSNLSSNAEFCIETPVNDMRITVSAQNGFSNGIGFLRNDETGALISYRPSFYGVGAGNSIVNFKSGASLTYDLRNSNQVCPQTSQTSFLGRFSIEIEQDTDRAALLEENSSTLQDALQKNPVLSDGELYKFTDTMTITFEPNL